MKGREGMNERLEEIAYHVAPTSDGNVVMSGEDYVFLYEYAVEQTERVEELEEENTGLTQDLKDILDKLESVSDV